MYETLKLERKGAAAWVTLTRPGEMNALNPALIADLSSVLEATADEDVAALVLTGAERAFCAGADLKFVESLDSDPERTMQEFLVPLTMLLRRLRALPLPVIAAVNGHCVAGGIELVLCCDLIVAAADGAAFSDGHSRYGLLPGIGGALGLARAVGPFRAKEMLFTADRYTATEMHAAGIVNWVVPDGQMHDFTLDLVRKLAQRSRSGLSAMKQMVNDGLDVPWDVAARYDLALHERHLYTGIPREGIRAFVERRTPNFSALTEHDRGTV